MELDTVIFDMDGLLVDSEPLWAIASNEIFEEYGFRLSPEQHITTTGLRTREFVHWWFSSIKYLKPRNRKQKRKYYSVCWT